MERVWMNKIQLAGADLTNANIQEAKLNDANLSRADLTGTRIHFATFQGTYMADCTNCPVDW